MVAVAIAAGFDRLLQPVLGPSGPLIVFFAAVMLASWLGGLGPGLLATGLSTLAAWYFLPPTPPFSSIPKTAGWVELGLVITTGLFITVLNEMRRRAGSRQAAAVTRRDLQREQGLGTAKPRLDRETEEELRIMSRIGQILAAELDLDRLVAELTEEATTAVRAQFGAFCHRAPGGMREQLLECSFSGVLRGAKIAGTPARYGATPWTTLAGGEAVVRHDDLSGDPEAHWVTPFSGLPESPEVRSYLAAPVVTGAGTILGSIFLGHSETGIFGEREERILRGIAASAAVALDNALLFREIRLARELAETASRGKDEFLATISHELRTPLNAMMGWAQLLQLQPDNREKLDRGLVTIVRNAKLQAQLIDDLLDVSRIVSGKMRLEVRAVDLSRVIDSALDSVRPAALAKQIRLRRLLDPLAGPVAGDPDRLQQVIWNLVSNAVKFTPARGHVEVRLERVNSHIEILVSDTGIGIAPELLPHVFDRFRQYDYGPVGKQGGLGLGLAIVRNLVELHGGTVRVKSPGEGRGSTFIVSLPVSIAHLDATRNGRVHPTAAADEPSLEDPTIDLQGVRVLVIDDEPDARETIQQILELCHAEVWTAASAAEGFAELERRRPDILVSDIGLPGEDGYSLIRRVRALPAERGGRTPALALTAFARGEDRRRALLAGFQMHLSKPVEISELAAVVANLARGLRDRMT